MSSKEIVKYPDSDLKNRHTFRNKIDRCVEVIKSMQNDDGIINKKQLLHYLIKYNLSIKDPDHILQQLPEWNDFMEDKVEWPIRRPTKGPKTPVTPT